MTSIRWCSASLALLCLIVTVSALTADDTDDEARRVLGGQPPIYGGPPIATDNDAVYKAYRNIPREDYARMAERQEIGRHCATEGGVFGPGANLPVGTRCAGRTVGNEILLGRVVSDRYGRHCLTPNGLFGPGVAQRVGSQCKAEDRTGSFPGTIISLP